MRGKLTDQDLTDYALNELDAHQRMYVESMLAVSVECRNDVYEMLEVAQMLEDGFEREAKRLPAILTGEQRAELVKPRRRRAALAFAHKAAATIAIAACVAFAITSPQLWHKESKVVQISTHVSDYVSNAVSPVADNVDISSYVNFEQIEDDASDFFQVASDALPQPAVICTPPSWLEGGSLPELH